LNGKVRRPLLCSDGVLLAAAAVQVVRVKSTMGWSYEFSLRPSSDLALYDKYNIAEYLQVKPSTNM
jgi:hypothetical protein